MDGYFGIAVALGLAGAVLIAGGAAASRRGGNTVVNVLGAAAMAAGAMSWATVLFITPVSRVILNEPPVPAPTPWDAGGPRLVKPGDIVTLKVGDLVEVAVDKGVAALHFKEVRNDSRCPKSVTCVRAGDATVALTGVGPDGASTELALLVEPGRESRERFAGLEVRVLDLLPYPESPGPIDQTDYTAIIVLASERR